MPTFRAEKTYTKTLVGPGVFNVSEDMAIRKIGISADNLVNGAVEMIDPIDLDGQVSDAIPVRLGVPVTITPAKSDGVLSGIKISVPGGGTLYIMAQI